MRVARGVLGWAVARDGDGAAMALVGPGGDAGTPPARCRGGASTLTGHPRVRAGADRLEAHGEQRRRPRPGGQRLAPRLDGPHRRGRSGHAGGCRCVRTDRRPSARDGGRGRGVARRARLGACRRRAGVGRASRSRAHDARDPPGWRLARRAERAAAARPSISAGALSAGADRDRARLRAALERSHLRRRRRRLVRRAVRAHLHPARRAADADADRAALRRRKGCVQPTSGGGWAVSATRAWRLRPTGSQPIGIYTVDLVVSCLLVPAPDDRAAPCGRPARHRRRHAGVRTTLCRSRHGADRRYDPPRDDHERRGCAPDQARRPRPGGSHDRGAPLRRRGPGPRRPRHAHIARLARWRRRPRRRRAAPRMASPSRGSRATTATRRSTSLASTSGAARRTRCS